MKKIVTLGFLLFAFSIYAQPDTEVYLFDMNQVDGKLKLTNLRNISNNEGYDNQPSFYDQRTILFSSTRNGQTDIAKYDIATGEISWITDTLGGGEYSPLRIANSDDISAVRLDSIGLQRLYRYNSAGESTLLRKSAKVGYQVWYSESILVNTILVENRMDLVVSNFKDNSNYTVQKNVGRSLLKIPGSELVSYISKESGISQLKSIHPITGATEFISPLPEGTEDIAWLPNGNLLLPEGNAIYVLHPETKENPEIIDLSEYKEISSISRMAISVDGKQLALVSEEPPNKIVQKQVDSYNAGNLDAFVSCYAENVVVRDFPADTRYVGHKKMRENYGSLSPENKVYDVEVVKRIVIGNKVIDQEKVTGNGKIQMQIALYEVNNGKISSMTFIFDANKVSNPENIVQTQMDAYNARDIEGFLDTYTEEVEIYNFPNEVRYVGKKKMRENYTGFFESTPDLNYSVRNRMVIRNIVIDEEYITANGNNFSAVAIYEVENGEISKVTFLR